MRKLKKIFEPITSIFLRKRATNPVLRLSRQTGFSGLVGQALKETLDNTLTPEEEVWVNRIEALRSALRSSSEEIRITDFGTGKPGQKLSKEEMEKGRIVVRKVGDVCRGAAKSALWCLFLFKLIQRFKPKQCLELGTNLGVSALYQGAALKLNGKGKLITLEGAESLIEMASGHFERFEMNNLEVVAGRFQDTLDNVLQSSKSFDYVYIDGHHDGEATVNYFHKIRPFLAENSLVIFDDISLSDGMRKAWDSIITDEKIKMTFDFMQIGICIFGDDVPTHETVSIPLI